MTTFDYNYQNSLRFCFVIEICQSRWGLKNNSPNLHKKTTNWRILVVVVKWCHRAIVLFRFRLLNFGSDDGTGNCRFFIMEFETEYWRRSPLILLFRTFYCGLKIWQTWEYQETEVVFYNAEHVTRYTLRCKKISICKVLIDFCRRWVRRIVMGFSQK